MELHGGVVFGGNGYSAEWHRAAVEERGLRNLPTTADALPVLKEPEVVALFERTGVLSPAELESRFDVYAEQYILSIGVESKMAAEMARTLVYPAAMSYLSDLGATISTASSLGVEIEPVMMKIVAEEANALLASADDLQTAAEVHDFDTVEEHMRYCVDTLRVAVSRTLLRRRRWPGASAAGSQRRTASPDGASPCCRRSRDRLRATSATA